ncbi:hypothetical protein GGI13_004630 [Coemansia sp. RSA 455]|nr:hypothetical protein LPJ71_000267 [Coemansia sp. S17]KAJ2041056.1 hypothetical protein H4S03_000624 [Coemansia sp. S3946]KAJ2065175.1 hypothetical protein GGI08_002259 [Coemansia sp. S2]KAJ2114644.1 hypothetical protein IW146_002936 [Coemansia sp. RSA 922]KAJ2248510.1 hypothetical protein GGI13_004630 [Coemansia sp. RSA 455]KAJ2344304.1 hypothetical protein GGH92_004543 [Coemansia sp. RSA 2673]KAJ2464547.1 hypothetical protein GGI03_003159 [Coemansia sp. RSA 2337]
MSADQPPPLSEEDAAPAWQQSQVLAQAIENAMASLGQQRVEGVTNVSILSDDEEEAGDGMTREIMGREYTENLTLSRVDFGQWMSNHAELEEEEEEQEEYEDFDEQAGPPVDVRDKWLADRVAWDLQNRAQAVGGGFGTEDDPITIGSSDVDDYEEEEECGEEEYYDEEEGSEVYGEDDGYDMDEYQQHALPHLRLNVTNDSGALVGSAQSVSSTAASQYHNGVECDYPQRTGPVTPGVDQAESVANAMLNLNGSLGSSTNDSATGAISPPLTGYQRPPLPPSSLPSSLIEMHKTISQSIDRSLSIVDEISTSCEAAANAWTESADVVTPADSAHGDDEVVRAFELETHDSIELAGQAIDRLRELQAESTRTQTALNTQIFKLSGELFQTTSERTFLENSVKQLERDNNEYMQTIDDLQQKICALRSASTEEIEALKERVRHVAGKISVTTVELSEANSRLEETRQVLTLVDGERTNLIGKCRGLETTVESLLLRLDAEHKHHEQTRRALHMATDGNANEARRAELEANNRGLEQRCKELVDEVGQSKNRERLLLNSNRALEARLGDILRKLDSQPDDSLAEYRRNWDLQLIESRREATLVRKRLETVESDLADERRGAEALKKRLLELETNERGDQSVKKRKYETVTSVAQRSFSYETPSRLPVDKSLTRNTLTDGLQQTLVDAGDYARDRRRKNNLDTPATEQRNIRQMSSLTIRPVTPRIGLTRQTPARRSDTPTAKPFR